MKPGIYLGSVFLPDLPTTIIESSRLNVRDSVFELEIPTVEIRYNNREILCGTFNGLGELTFVNCRLSAGQSGGGGRFMTFTAEYCLSGHFANIDSLIFHEARVFIPSLFQWLQVHSIESNLFLSDCPHIHIVEPEDITIDKIKDFSLSFIFYHSYSSMARDGEIILREGAGLKIEAIGTGKHITEFIEIIFSFLKLLYFVTNSNCSVDSIKLFDLNSDSTELFSHHFKPYKPSTSHFRNFTYSNLKIDLAKIVSRWFLEDRIHVSIDLILEKATNIGISRENFFLNTCFAIETLHRSFQDYKLLPPKEFKLLRKKMLNELTPEEAEFVNDKFSHFNSPSFRQRLLDYKGYFNVLLPPNVDPENYIATIVNTRNFLVHRSSKRETFDRFDLLYAAIYLEGLVKLQISKILGISEKLIQLELKSMHEGLFVRYQLNKKSFSQD